MLDDHGGYADAHGGSGGSGRLWGLGGLRDHSLDDGESPGSRSRPGLTVRPPPSPSSTLHRLLFSA
jgi:hypothetical protein